MVDPDDPRHPPRTLDGLLIAGAALAVYILLAQGSFYKVDGQALLYLSHLGVTQHGYHTFYLPLLQLLKSVCMPRGMSLFDTATLLSALGTFVGVWLVHCATRRLGLDRFGTNVVTALFALCPGVMFFATVVEVHGAFLPFAGLAMLAMAHAARSPRWWNAVLLGLALGLAYLSHPTGALMLCLVPVVQAVAGRESGSTLPWRRRASVVAIAAAGLIAVLAIAPRLLRSQGAAVDVGTAASIVGAFSAHGLSIGHTPVVLFEEWFVPFLMASAIVPLALIWREGRTATLWLLAGIAPYVFGAQLMLNDYSERGAYLLPVAWPTALVALTVIRQWRALVLPALALTATVAVVQIERHDHPDRPRLYAAGLREVAGGAHFQLLAGHELDMEAWLIGFDDEPVLYIGQFADQDPASVGAMLKLLDQGIEEQRHRGRATFMSDLGLQSLREAAARGQWPLSHDPELWVGGRSAAAILEHLEKCYEFVPVKAKGFEGVRLVPRE